MGGTLPWARGVGRPTLGWGEGAFLGFPCRTSFSLRCVPPLSPGVRVVRPTLAFPPLLPARAPPSWHVRLQEIAKPWLWRPELGPPPLPAPLPSSLRCGVLGRGGRPGSCQAREEGRAGRPQPPGNGPYHPAGSFRDGRPGAGCRAGWPAPWGRGGEGGAWGGRNHRGGVGR